MRTAADAPSATGAARFVLDSSNATDLVAGPDSVTYQLPDGVDTPAVGDIVTTSLGDGFIRRVLSVEVNGSEVTLQTAAAALIELLTDAQLANDVKLIDVPSEQSLAGAAAMRTLQASQVGGEQRLHWPERGLTLSQRPLPTTLKGPTAAAPSSTGGCDGTAPLSELDTDAPLEVRYPRGVCVEPGTALQFDIEVEIESGHEAEFEITQLQLEKVTHPKISKHRPNYGAVWSQPDHWSDTRGHGTLSWLPDDHHIDDESRPFKAYFVAMARKRDCGLFDFHCTRRIDIEVPIYVTWGELPGPTDQSFSGSDSQLALSGEVRVDFQPEVTAEADLRGASLDRALVQLEGPLSFTTEVRLEASAAGQYGFEQTLLDKRFVKVLWAGQVPIVINGRLQLRVEFLAEAEGALDISQELALGYDLLAGLEYDGAWHVIQGATPWQRYELKGEADTRGSVELRFVPELVVDFYDVAGGRFLVEPYLYGEAALEGHFVYRDGTGGAGSDADYRFTDLEFGGGIDAGFRLGLEVFDLQLAGYPSTDPDELHRFALLDETPILGLPTLAPFATADTLRIDGTCALGLDYEVTPVANPFQGLVGGPDTFNEFVADSAQWQAVLPPGNVTLTAAGEPGKAWFQADTAGQYTLRFAGHSALGSFIRQYQEIQVDYDPAQLDCPGAGAPWVSPASGAWTSSPQWLQVSSDGAEILYYTLVNTTDGTAPADPATPSPTLNDGALLGPVADFELYNQTPGTLKRSKLRFIGCSGPPGEESCGPASGVYEFSIDLRGGGGVSVAPASEVWLTSPQYIAVSSSGANKIYYRMVNTYDGTSPADPAPPSWDSFDGVLPGPEATFTYYGSPGQLKRSKLQFVGCTGQTCGPVSGVYEYRIDLRSEIALVFHADGLKLKLITMFGGVFFRTGLHLLEELIRQRFHHQTDFNFFLVIILGAHKDAQRTEKQGNNKK